MEGDLCTGMYRTEKHHQAHTEVVDQEINDNKQFYNKGPNNIWSDK